MTPIKQNDIKPTAKGLTHLLTELRKKGTIENKNILVSAVWSKFKTEKMYFETHGIETIDVIGQGKNIADGYLFFHGLTFFRENNEKFEQVVLIGGDGVYVPLVMEFLKRGKKVNIFGWKGKELNDGINPTYQMISDSNDNLVVSYIEELFGFDSGLEELIEKGLFEGDVTTEYERSIILFINSLQERGKGTIWKDGIAANFGKNENFKRDFATLDTFVLGKSFLNDCVKQKILNEKLMFNPSKGREKEELAIELNYDHKKVKKILRK